MDEQKRNYYSFVFAIFIPQYSNSREKALRYIRVVHSSSRRRFQREKERDSENSESSKSASRGLCLSFEEEMVISLSTKEGGTFTYFRVRNPKHFFLPLLLSFSLLCLFPFFPFKIGTYKKNESV